MFGAPSLRGDSTSFYAVRRSGKASCELRRQEKARDPCHLFNTQVGHTALRQRKNTFTHALEALPLAEQHEGGEGGATPQPRLVPPLAKQLQQLEEEVHHVH